jgi:hypothetical protein
LVPFDHTSRLVQTRQEWLVTDPQQDNRTETE